MNFLVIQSFDMLCSSDIFEHVPVDGGDRGINRIGEPKMLLPLDLEKIIHTLETQYFGKRNIFSSSESTIDSHATY